jgi:PTH1 family peptidyl-tRNA hydrolase
MKFLIVGLGNIGIEYEATRHNVGFMVAEQLAANAKTSFEVSRLASIADFRHKGKSIYIIKPSTYMNLSGKAVNYWMQQLKIPLANTLIVADDIALPLDRIRMRARGSSAGHNGLKSIEEIVGSNYPRLRIGIGDNFSRGRQIDFVLGRFTDKEEDLLPNIIDQATKAVLSFCTVGIARTMNLYNN